MRIYWFYFSMVWWSGFDGTVRCAALVIIFQLWYPERVHPEHNTKLRFSTHLRVIPSRYHRIYNAAFHHSLITIDKTLDTHCKFSEVHSSASLLPVFQEGATYLYGICDHLVVCPVRNKEYASKSWTWILITGGKYTTGHDDIKIGMDHCRYKDEVLWILV